VSIQDQQDGNNRTCGDSHEKGSRCSMCVAKQKRVLEKTSPPELERTKQPVEDDGQGEKGNRPQMDRDTKSLSISLGRQSEKGEFPSGAWRSHEGVSTQTRGRRGISGDGAKLRGGFGTGEASVKSGRMDLERRGKAKV